MSWRYLKTNSAEWRPQNVLCVDTETTRVCLDVRRGLYLEKFRLGVAKLRRLSRGRYSCNRESYFTDTGTFWDFVESQAKPKGLLWIFAHNVGFDSRTLGFWTELDRGRFTRTYPRNRKHGSKSGKRQSENATGLLITNDPPTVVEFWTKSGAKVRFIDTLNFWPTSLASIGGWVGLEKLTFPDPWESDETWFRYCSRDVDILMRAVLKYIAWVRENQLGIFSVTLPSQAMHGYRHTSPAKSIVIHDELDVQKLEGESYYGGEVYIGKIGRVGASLGTSQLNLGDTRPKPDPTWTREVHQLDCNSLFPAVMANNLYPRKLVTWGMGETAKRSLVASMGPDCIAECLIDTGLGNVFTRRAGRSGRFTGLFVANLVGPELARAIQDGIVIAVRRWARYEMADLFSSWVNRWWLQRWTAKLHGDNFASELCKRIMNSLYGKWAQRNHEWEDVPGMFWPERWASWVDLDLTTNEPTHFRSIAGTVQKSITRGFHENAFVAISSFTTSYARERMRTLRDIAGRGNVYYQGVDSLYVSDDGLERLHCANEIDGGKLGLLRHEQSAETADFVGWGLYRFGERWVRTAIGRGAIECTPGEFEQNNFQRLTAAIGSNPIDGVRVETVKKTIAAASPVGIVDKNGWVSPLRARWGDNPVETTSPGEFYSGDICDRHEQVAKTYSS